MCTSYGDPRSRDRELRHKLPVTMFKNPLTFKAKISTQFIKVMNALRKLSLGAHGLVTKT